MLSISIVPEISRPGGPVMIVVQCYGDNRRRYRTGAPRKVVHLLPYSAFRINEYPERASTNRESPPLTSGELCSHRAEPLASIAS